MKITVEIVVHAPMQDVWRAWTNLHADWQAIVDNFARHVEPKR